MAEHKAPITLRGLMLTLHLWFDSVMGDQQGCVRAWTDGRAESRWARDGVKKLEQMSGVCFEVKLNAFVIRDADEVNLKIFGLKVAKQTRCCSSVDYKSMLVGMSSSLCQLGCALAFHGNTEIGWALISGFLRMPLKCLWRYET